MWLPFELYRQEHLQHHQDERLTDPLDDPETYYWTPAALQRLNPVLRASLRVQQTLAGRWESPEPGRVEVRLVDQDTATPAM